MKYLTLFLNAMRLASEIDCRQFGVRPGYGQALESELCGDLMSRRTARRVPAEKAAAEKEWGALSY